MLLSCYQNFSCRYIGVVKDLHKSSLSTMKGAKVEVNIVMLCSVILEIPRMFEYKIIQRECNGHIYHVRPRTGLADNDVYAKLNGSIIYSLFKKYIPLLVICILTFHLVRFLRVSNRLRKYILSNGFCNQGEQSHISMDIHGLLDKGSGCYCLYVYNMWNPQCYLPIVRHFVDSDSCTSAFSYFFHIADLLSLLNSSLNFSVYYVNIPAFRKCLKDILKKCCIRRKKARDL